MHHSRARLTQFGRLLLVQRVEDEGWPVAQAAKAVAATPTPAVFKNLRREICSVSVICYSSLRTGESY